MWLWVLLASPGLRLQLEAPQTCHKHLVLPSAVSFEGLLHSQICDYLSPLKKDLFSVFLIMWMWRGVYGYICVPEGRCPRKPRVSNPPCSWSDRWLSAISCRYRNLNVGLCESSQCCWLLSPFAGHCSSLFIFMCVSVLLSCMYVHRMHTWFPQGSKERIAYLPRNWS